MRLSQSEVLEMASAEGFDPPALEKVLHLMNLLNMLNAHPYLKGKWILKGGTALNLFLLRMPRLSVDIDLNYVRALDRETMLDERLKVEQAVQAVCSREGFNVRRVPTEHAGMESSECPTAQWVGIRNRVSSVIPSDRRRTNDPAGTHEVLALESMAPDRAFLHKPPLPPRSQLE